mmetsp:Transcript_14666/g.41513  ORF Transcript_14666/g.41513 Transcript_14666/m.41513 type:complete len:410 (-) Transcript_14666:328-1557(-)
MAAVSGDAGIDIRILEVARQIVDAPTREAINLLLTLVTGIRTEIATQGDRRCAPKCSPPIASKPQPQPPMWMRILAPQDDSYKGAILRSAFDSAPVHLGFSERGRCPRTLSGGDTLQQLAEEVATLRSPSEPLNKPAAAPMEGKGWRRAVTCPVVAHKEPRPSQGAINRGVSADSEASESLQSGPVDADVPEPSSPTPRSTATPAPWRRPAPEPAQAAAAAAATVAADAAEKQSRVALRRVRDAKAPATEQPCAEGQPADQRFPARADATAPSRRRSGPPRCLDDSRRREAGRVAVPYRVNFGNVSQKAREGTMRQLLRIAMSSDSAQQVPAPPSQARPADQGGESPPSKEQQQQQQKAQQFQLTGDWQLRFPLQQWHLQQHQEQQRQQQQTQPQSPQEKRLGSLPEEW